MMLMEFGEGGNRILVNIERMISMTPDKYHPEASTWILFEKEEHLQIPIPYDQVLEMLPMTPMRRGNAIEVMESR